MNHHFCNSIYQKFGWAVLSLLFHSVSLITSRFFSYFTTCQEFLNECGSALVFETCTSFDLSLDLGSRCGLLKAARSFHVNFTGSPWYMRCPFCNQQFLSIPFSFVTAALIDSRCVVVRPAISRILLVLHCSLPSKQGCVLGRPDDFTRRYVNQACCPAWLNATAELLPMGVAQFAIVSLTNWPNESIFFWKSLGSISVAIFAWAVRVLHEVSFSVEARCLAIGRHLRDLFIVNILVQRYIRDIAIHVIFIFLKVSRLVFLLDTVSFLESIFLGGWVSVFTQGNHYHDKDEG